VVPTSAHRNGENIHQSPCRFPNMGQRWKNCFFFSSARHAWSGPESSSSSVKNIYIALPRTRQRGACCVGSKNLITNTTNILAVVQIHFLVEKKGSIIADITCSYMCSNIPASPSSHIYPCRRKVKGKKQIRIMFPQMVRMLCQPSTPSKKRQRSCQRSNKKRIDSSPAHPTTHTLTQRKQTSPQIKRSSPPLTDSYPPANSSHCSA
jgi:hypothetical protein